MRRYSIEPRTRDMLNDIDVYHLPENRKNNFWIQD